MRYLIIGGAGFIGSNLVEHHVHKGNEVVVCDNLHTGSLENLSSVKDSILFIKANARDLTPVEVGHIDGIYNLGIYSSSPMYKENPFLMGDALKDFLNVLLLSKDAGVKQVWASTSSIYNGNPTPWREDMPVYVRDYYGEIRYYMERLAALHYEWYGTPSLAMRFFSVYGPKEEAKGTYANLVTQFLWAMKEGEPAVIYGDGTQRRDFIHVSDVVNALNRAMYSSVNQDVFNVGTGTSYSLNELVEVLNEVLGTSIAPRYVPNTIRGYVSETLADVNKAQDVLGFSAIVSLIEGIKLLLIDNKHIQ